MSSTTALRPSRSARATAPPEPRPAPPHPEDLAFAAELRASRRTALQLLRNVIYTATAHAESQSIPSPTPAQIAMIREARMAASRILATPLPRISDADPSSPAGAAAAAPPLHLAPALDEPDLSPHDRWTDDLSLDDDLEAVEPPTDAAAADDIPASLPFTRPGDGPLAPPQPLPASAPTTPDTKQAAASSAALSRVMSAAAALRACCGAPVSTTRHSSSDERDLRDLRAATAVLSAVSDYRRPRGTQASPPAPP